MAKFNAKEFLLTKGEKIVLIAALVGLGIFAVLGISQFVSAESPARKSAEFKDTANAITSRVQRSEGVADIKPLDASLMGESSFITIDSKHFRNPALPFEPVDTPSNKRDNPVVLGITEAQVDLVRAPVKAYEVLVQDGVVKIGLLYNVKMSKLDEDSLKKLMKDIGSTRARRPVAPPQVTAPPPPPQPVPAPPATTAITPGGGGARGERGGRGGAPSAVAPGERIEKTLRYVLLDDFDKETAKDGVLPALSVYPVRMIVVHASFPLKEQLEVIRRALRLRTIEDAAKESAPEGGGQGPTFLGFEVERRIVSPTGEVYDWLPYDHVGQYLNKIQIRKFADQPDDGFLAYFLRYHQMMAMPLPALAANLGIYPGVRLEAIVKGYKKLQDANKKPESASEMATRFSGKAGGAANPFMPSTSAAGGLGGFGTDAPAQGLGRGAPVTGRIERPGSSDTVPGALQVPTNMPELEHMLLRFLDVDVRPGFTYQYRVRIKMKNPNFKKTAEVARPDDAKQEVLWGPWVTIANQVSVPVDHNVYAGDPVQYAENLRRDFKDPNVINLLDNKNGEVPVVQFQTWTERVAIDSGKSEPAGYWVVAEVPVQRGEYVGRKQIVSLPMWSSEKIQFILQQLPKYTVWKAREQPKGMLVDFSTQTLLVDYEGGKTRTKVSDRDITDESDIELLLLQPDGQVVVRSSGVDREDADRKAREEAWKKWLDEIKKATDAVGAPTVPGGGTSIFG